MALTLRLEYEDDKALRDLSESLGFLPIDLTRAAIKALLEVAKENRGQITLPLKMVSAQETALILNLIVKRHEQILGAGNEASSVDELNSINNLAIKIMPSNSLSELLKQSIKSN